MALQHLRSSTANKRPTPAAMADGQIAINTEATSPGLFFKNASGSLVKVGPVHVGTTAPNASPASGGETGNTLGEQWLDTTGGTYVFKVWDGSAWRSETGTFVDVNGDTMTGALGIIAGSAASPGLFVSGDTNTGIYSPGADQIALATGGTGRVFVDSSGNFLIGTSSALSAAGFTSVLQVQANTASSAAISMINTSNDAFAGGLITYKSRGGAAVQSGDTLAQHRFIGFDGTTYIEGVRILASVDGTPGTNSMPSRLSFSTTASGASNPTERLRITSAGLVGIGTSSPVSTLDINGAVGIIYDQGLQLYRQTGTVNNTILGHTFTGGNDQLNISPAGNSTTSAVALRTATGSTLSTRLFISPTGNVGIGTTSPGVLLHLQQSTGAEYLRFTANNATTDGDSTITLAAIKAGTAYHNFLYQASSHQFLIGGSERARIDSSGRLLVGTSTSLGTTAKNIESASNIAISTYVNNAFGYELTFNKSRGSTNGTIVQNGDNIGNISWRADDGTDTDTVAAQISAAVDGTPGANDMPGRLVFSTTADGASSPTERVRITSGGAVLVAKTADDINTQGIRLSEFGVGSFCRDAEIPLFVNRNTNDGSLVVFRQAGTDEGSISVSGTTVSYNGAHLSRWSQLPSGAERTEILRGSVLSNIDEMCEWGEEDNEQLNRMKVSDVEGDKNVSGVFQAWDDDDDTYTNDFYCAMTGDFIIRIGAGVTVERGDLLMSAGDGTAKPQEDDIIRSKTIAKVTSTNVSCTYDDGSYCVPCVLMAC